MVVEIEGFIQFRSPVFAIGLTKNILIKLTNSLNCLCNKPIYNILITWESTEAESARLHRESFITSLNSWIHQRVLIRALSYSARFVDQVISIDYQYFYKC